MGHVLPLNNTAAFLSGIIGIVISAILYLTPMPIFYGVLYDEGLIEGLTPVPYSISIFTCMLRIYYALLRGYVPLLIINIFGFIFSTIYITIYLIYAPKKDKIRTSMLIIILLDVALFSLILLITLLLWEGEERIDVLNWIYLSCLTITAFVSPLSTICQVIQSGSIKCMSFYDLLLTILGSSAWLAYAILINNIHIAVLNALSLMFGVIQMVIYMKYKDVDSTRPTEESTGAREIDIEMVEY